MFIHLGRIFEPARRYTNQSSLFDTITVMEWKVVFFESRRGEKPVEEFFYNQQLQAQAKMLHLFELFKTYGSQLGMPHAKHLGLGIYELRIRGKEELRIFYGFKQRTIYLLHAFKKQTQKTPRREFEIAKQRLTSI